MQLFVRRLGPFVFMYAEAEVGVNGPHRYCVIAVRHRRTSH